MSVTPIGIGIIGCGTVGQGVVKLLQTRAEAYTQRLGRPLEIRKILVRDLSRQRQVDLPNTLFTDDSEDFFNTEGIQVVVEVAGGVNPVGDFVRRALRAGQHVVTANKSLLAAHGPELFQIAREHNASIAFEASCGGGIPIIHALQFGLPANQIQAMYGILNGTCNYILTQMTREGKSYDEALGEAQAAGFAEADPTLDVSGADTAQKLAILASLAFGGQAKEADVQCEGVDSLKLEDLQFGAELGYDIKLLAIGERFEQGLSLRVHPCFIANDEQIAQVRGSFNALSVYGHAVGHTFYYGRGAGDMPTASAVVGDLLNVASGWYPDAFARTHAWPDQGKPLMCIDPDELETRYYLRISAKDVPGVVAQFSAILGEEGISLSSVLQHETNVGQFVPVVITTHQAREGAIRKAAQRIADLPTIEGSPVCIRIVDMPAG